MIDKRTVFVAAALAVVCASPSVAQQPAPAASSEVALRPVPLGYAPERLSVEFHRGRREAVLAALPDSSLAIVLSAPVRQRSRDVEYEYRQSSYLYYLTGMTEPASALVLAPDGFEVDGRRVTELLFVPRRDPAREMWTGRRLGASGAVSELGLAMAVENTRMREILEPLLAQRSVLMLPWPEGWVERSPLGAQIEFLQEHAKGVELVDGPLAMMQRGMLSVTGNRGFRVMRGRMERIGGASRFDGTYAAPMAHAFMNAADVEAWFAWRDENLSGYADTYRLEAIIDGLREVKGAEELDVLQRAIDITAEAHREALAAIEPGMYEYEVEALIEYVFHREGAEHTGFPSIVGSGENSVVLHYDTNRRRMERGDLVVMDIGAEYRSYSADVTRTVPVSGEFTDPQRALYGLVLKAQEAAIQAARVGATLSDLQAAASAVLASGLRQLGILRDPADLRRFFPHGVSHHLGLDVHDVTTYGPLRAGNVITVEPGIYIGTPEGVDEQWHNTGIRIEDDVLITEAGPVVLSAGAPKTEDEIEALMR
jgi:Xaa-Pro aminopeptidase